MASGRASGVIAAVFTVQALAAPLVAVGNDAWDAFDSADNELRGLEAELRVCSAAIDVCREGLAARQDGEMKALRQALADAETAVTAANAQAELAAARDAMQTARAARDAKAQGLVASSPAWRAANDRLTEVTKKIEEMTGRVAVLNLAEVQELVRLRGEKHDLDRHIHGSLRALWSRGEVAAEFQAADAAYRAYGAVSGESGALKQANEKVKSASKALDAAIAALPLEGSVGQALVTRRMVLEEEIAALKGNIAEMEKNLVGSGSTVSTAIQVFDRKSKEQVERKVSLWLPPNHEVIRGIIIAHPMVKGLVTSRATRLAAAREGLGMMVCGDIPADPKEAVAQFDAMFETFAEASGHPEIRGAPIMVGGLSASVLATRNIACVAPERVFGVVHVAGGNMHQMPDGGRGMIEVPFLAHNGEFEWCGPEGGGHASGKAGIRLEYGQQTQWVMIREQMLRLWRDGHKHRMSLVVVPNADHGAWDVGLTALFIRKCAQYRLPKEKRDGSRPAVCTPLPVNQGWLTDADLDHPKYAPSPYDSYAGDKNNAFWHLDQEMAEAVYNYHKGRFILPDPTKVSPVPADWPPSRK